jgi:hypothetical protein
MTRRLGLLLGGGLLWVATAASADKPVRTWNYLTTGNGHGFQFFDTNKNKITHFLEAPYRYLRPRADPRSDGIGRRNLAYDFYFGVRGQAAAAGSTPAPPARRATSRRPTSSRCRSPSRSQRRDVLLCAVWLRGQRHGGGPQGAGRQRWLCLFNFHMGDGSPDTPNANNERLKVLSDGKSIAETGSRRWRDDLCALTPSHHADCDNAWSKVNGGQSLGDNRSCSGNDVVPAFQPSLDGGHMAVAVLFVDE